MGATDFPFAYLSPETLLPAASILATIAGVVMMIGSRTMRLACRWLGRSAALARSAGRVPAPHFRKRGESPLPAGHFESDLHEPGDLGRDAR